MFVEAIGPDTMNIVFYNAESRSFTGEVYFSTQLNTGERAEMCNGTYFVQLDNCTQLVSISDNVLQEFNVNCKAYNGRFVRYNYDEIYDIETNNTHLFYIEESDVWTLDSVEDYYQLWFVSIHGSRFGINYRGGNYGSTADFVQLNGNFICCADDIAKHINIRDSDHCVTMVFSNEYVTIWELASRGTPC